MTANAFEPNSFRLVESFGHADPQMLRKLFNGEIPCIFVRNVLSKSECSNLMHAFLKSAGSRPRPDGVPGLVLGAYHYGKSLDQYLAEIDETREHVQRFLDAGNDPVARTLRDIGDAIRAEGRTLRRARWAGWDAALARALLWRGVGEYMLDLHDDVGQLTDSRQSEFEAQRMRHSGPIAINIYPQVPEGGGILRFWNLRPDDAMRMDLGISSKGYPYPIDHVSDAPSIDVPAESGSVVMMNGALVHAVVGYGNRELSLDQGRLLINLFAGNIDATTTIHWV